MRNVDRLCLAHLWVAFVTFLAAAVLGAWQMWVRSPLGADVGTPGLYFMSVTAHGVAMANAHPELKAVAATPEVRDVIVRIGTIPVDSPPPAELQKFLASEIDRWGSLIQRAGLTKTE